MDLALIPKNDITFAITGVDSYTNQNEYCQQMNIKELKGAQRKKNLIYSL